MGFIAIVSQATIPEPDRESGSHATHFDDDYDEWQTLSVLTTTS